MTCDCKSVIEAQLLANFEKATPDATDHGVTLQGYGIRFVANTAELAGFMPYEAQAAHLKKDGGVRVKKLKGNMMFSFCPFCGEKS